MRTIFQSVILGAGLLGSSSAMAGTTGNAAAVTEYMFRGVEQSSGAALQGGLDYAHDSGFYIGTWVSNTSFAAPAPNPATVTYETDVYGGWTTKVGGLGLDFGAIYYYYRDATELNTLEAYIGASFGVVSAKAYYTTEYFGTVDATGDEVEGLYVTASAALPLSDTLTLTPQVGFSSGDGPEIFFGNAPGTTTPDGEYLDYSLTLTKSLDNGFSFSFAAIGTTLDTTLFASDNEKIVLGLKKTFDL